MQRFLCYYSKADLGPAFDVRLDSAAHLLCHGAEICVRLVERGIAAIFQHRFLFIRFQSRPCSKTAAGVIAFSRCGDPASGEYEDARVFCSYGSLPVLEVETAIAC